MEAVGRERAQQNAAGDRVAEIDDLWQDWSRLHTRETRNRLASIYYPLARNMARMMARSLAGRAELGDLESYAAEGLLGAIERFDPGKGVDFPGFAAYRIRYAILDGVRNADWVPRSVRDRERRLRTLEEETFGTRARAPREEEEAEHLGVTIPDFRRLKALASRTTISSINALLDQPERADRNEPVDGEPGPLDNVLAVEVLDALREGLARLPERQKIVIGLSLNQGTTLAEIGRRLGMSESRACQIRTSGIRSLRTYLESRGLLSA